MNKVHIGHDCIIEDDVILSVLTSTGGVVIIKRFANLGQGVIVKGRLTIGENAMIGCNTTVLNDIPDFQTWAGCPARFIRFNTRGMKKRGISSEEISRILGIVPTF